MTGFVLRVLQYLGNWYRRLHSKFPKVVQHRTIDTIFEEDMIRGTLTILTILDKSSKRKTKIPQSNFPNFGIYFREYVRFKEILLKFFF